MADDSAHETVQELDPHLVWMFEQEIIYQWDHAARAVVMMNAVLKQQVEDQDLFWFALDAALGALGNISKIFWPTGPAKSYTVARCAHLRREYGIADDSMLSSRKARDAIEHFDERLDRWYRESVRRNFADRIIAPPGMIVGIDPGDYARHYDPESQVVTVSGEALDFPGLVSEVDALVSAVRTRHEVPWWNREGATKRRS